MTDENDEYGDKALEQIDLGDGAMAGAYAMLEVATQLRELRWQLGDHFGHEMDIATACQDCGSPWDWYMLKDEVWAATGGSTEPDMSTFLCIRCVEDRLGRTLTPDDFTDAPVNDLDDPGFHGSERLTSRLRGDT